MNSTSKEEMASRMNDRFMSNLHYHNTNPIVSGNISTSINTITPGDSHDILYQTNTNFRDKEVNERINKFTPIGQARSHPIKYDITGFDMKPIDTRQAYYNTKKQNNSK